MTTDTSIGIDDVQPEPHASQSGIKDEANDDEGRPRSPTPEGEPDNDLTREDIEAGNDENTSADQPSRSGRTSRGDGSDAIELGK